VCGGCQNPKFRELECATCEAVVTSVKMLGSMNAAHQQELEKYNGTQRTICELKATNERLLEKCNRFNIMNSFLDIELTESNKELDETQSELTKTRGELSETMIRLADSNAKLDAAIAALETANGKLAIANSRLDDLRRHDARTMKLKLWFGEKKVTMPMPLDAEVTDITLG
jgi:chromosome segregation ATPase